MLRSLLLPVLAITLGHIPNSGQIPTLRDRVKALGRDLTMEHLVNYPAPDFETLVLESDTIVVVTVAYGVPVLTREGAMLETDYHVSVRQVVRRSVTPAIVPGDTLVARRLGGATTIEGFNVSILEPDFPPFNAGETYVLFLASKPDATYLTFRYGAQDAFLVMPDNNVKQVSISSRGTWNQERGLVGLRVFLAEVRKVISTPR